MTFIVFTQSEDGLVDEAKLVLHATQFFGTKLEILGHKPAGRKDQPAETRIAFRSTQDNFDATFTLITRTVQTADLRAARDAEVRGQVPGMGTLAEDCHHVWEVSAGNDVPEKASYLLCAVLASVALGPILPPEHDTLLTVRSARARADGGTQGYRD